MDKIFNTNNERNSQFILYVIFSIPVLILTGPFLPDLTLTILSIFFLIIFFKKKIQLQYLFKYKFLFLFWISILVSSFLSKNIFVNVIESTILIRFILFLILFCFLVEKFNQLEKLFYVLLGIFVLLALDAYIQLLFGKNLLGFIKDDPKRLSGLFGDEYILGSYLLKFFPIILFLCPKEQKKMNFLIIFFFIIIEPLIFFSGQRSQFIMSFFLVFGIFLLNFKNIYFYMSFAICCLIILSNIFFNQKYYERYIYDVKANFSFDNSVKLGKDSKEKVINFSIISPSHTKIYFNSINMFKDKIFFGHGIKSYRLKCKDYDKDGCTTHPHNFYLQILAETGLITFIIIFLFYLAIIKEIGVLLYSNFFHKNININRKYYACLNLFIILFPFQSNGNFFNNYMLVQLVFILSVYFISMSLND
mgnify:CR=1 FL=1